MTAEIVIMNKGAIALAADSAVTVGDRDKIYNSSNKLFMLSKYKPVGIMVYNNSEFMGVPWETLIKIYKAKLNQKEFDTIEGYGGHFLEFLTSKELVLQLDESKYVENTIIAYLRKLIDHINSYNKERFDSVSRELTDEEYFEITDLVIQEHLEKIVQLSDLESMPLECRTYVSETYSQLIENLKNQLLDSGFKISEKNFLILQHIYGYLFTKDLFFDHDSGIVFAGFGQNELFPSLVSYRIEGIINGNLKYCISQQEKISQTQDSCIIPFAQTDVVNTFLIGINSSYLQTIEQAFRSQLIDNTEVFKDIGLNDEHQIKIKSLLQNIWGDINTTLGEYLSEKYNSIVSTLKSLPKEELALMAESLVNLTSFKRKVSMDDSTGTVGGPIDVAVISKGDGFIWIKRKHYFKPELNHHFFANYFESVKGDSNDEN